MSNILIVEADPMVAHIMKNYLEKIDNFNVYGPVATIEEITSVLREHEISLIFLDAYLPRQSGFEVLRLLREKEYYESIVMVTAANTVGEVQKAYAYGVIDYIIKPFEITRLDKTMQKYMAVNRRLKGKNVLSQEDLDRDDVSCNHLDLPKGLNRTTYMKILDKLKEDSSKKWTLRELAADIQISNVTIKKYMDYFVQTGIAEANLNYGQVGRPEYRFFLRT